MACNERDADCKNRPIEDEWQSLEHKQRIFEGGSASRTADTLRDEWSETVRGLSSKSSLFSESTATHLDLSAGLVQQAALARETLRELGARATALSGNDGITSSRKIM